MSYVTGGNGTVSRSLNRVKAVFPSCPLCLATVFDVTPLDEDDTLGEKLRVRVRCRTSKARWRLVAYDQPYITLLELGTNPRKLEGIPVREVRDQAYWQDMRRPIRVVIHRQGS
jgi:hypothetical protein